MDYINTIVRQNTSIKSSVKLIKELPVAHKLNDIVQGSSRNELWLIGIVIFFALYNLSFHLKNKRQHLNLPPTIPFGLPLFGHTLYIMLMPRIFLDWCNERYGEVYNLTFLGNVITVTSGRSAEEAFKAHHTVMSIDEGIVRDVLHLDYVVDDKTMKVGININPLIAKAVIPSSKMSSYVPSIQFGIENACKVLLNEKTTLCKDPNQLLQTFVAYMSVPGLFGEEFSMNADIIDSSANFTGDVIKSVPWFMIIPRFLHKFVLPYIQPSRRPENMRKHLVPIVIKRREKMKLAKEAGVDHGYVQNYLQCLIAFENTDKNGLEYQCTPQQVSDLILLIAFASVHTTSKNLNHGVYWLLARPDLKKRFTEEYERVLPNNAPITHAALAEMKFLNNFTREILRQSADYLVAGKKAMKDFTFNNGYQVPEGRVVGFNFRQINFGDNYNRDSIEGMDPDMSFDKCSTTPSKDYIPFGAGKHVCPGRFLAVQEIQMSLIHLFRNYDIQTVSGKSPQPLNTMAGYMSISCNEPLIFTRKN